MASGILRLFEEPSGGFFWIDNPETVERDLLKRFAGHSLGFSFSSAEPDSIELFVKPGDNLRLRRGENVRLLEYTRQELDGTDSLVRHCVMVRFE
jgi:hypothetical protein